MAWFSKQVGWVKALLMASLALNLFFGAFIAARLLRPQPPPPRPVITLDLQSLPEGARGKAMERIEEAMRERRRELRRTYREYIKARSEAFRLLSEQELNEQALRKAYEEMRQLSSRIQEPIHEAVIQALRQVEPSERRRILRQARLHRSHPPQLRSRVDGNRWQLEFRDGDIELDFEDLLDETDEDGGNPPQ